MGNYEQLKQAVSDVIKTNGNQEITGAILQNTLLTIISTIGNNYTFAGIATPTTNPGTPDQNIFYLASESGVYSNFGGVELTDEVLVFINKNGNWVYKKLGIYTISKINEIEPLILVDYTSYGVNSGNVNVSRKGEYYYNSNVKKIYKVTSFNSKYDFTVKTTVPIEGQLYVYKGVLYSWNGVDMVLSNPELINPIWAEFDKNVELKNYLIYGFYDNSGILNFGNDKNKLDDRKSCIIKIIPLTKYKITFDDTKYKVLVKYYKGIDLANGLEYISSTYIINEVEYISNSANYMSISFINSEKDWTTLEPILDINIPQPALLSDLESYKDNLNDLYASNKKIIMSKNNSAKGYVNNSGIFISNDKSLCYVISNPKFVTINNFTELNYQVKLFKIIDGNLTYQRIIGEGKIQFYHNLKDCDLAVVMFYQNIEENNNINLLEIINNDYPPKYELNKIIFTNMGENPGNLIIGSGYRYQPEIGGNLNHNAIGISNKRACNLVPMLPGKLVLTNNIKTMNIYEVTNMVENKDDDINLRYCLYKYNVSILPSPETSYNHDTNQTTFIFKSSKPLLVTFANANNTDDDVDFDIVSYTPSSYINEETCNIPIHVNEFGDNTGEYDSFAEPIMVISTNGTIMIGGLCGKGNAYQNTFNSYSIDKGKTWTNKWTDGHRYLCYDKVNDILYSLDGEYLYASNDFGMTWEFKKNVPFVKSNDITEKYNLLREEEKEYYESHLDEQRYAYLHSVTQSPNPGIQISNGVICFQRREFIKKYKASKNEQGDWIIDSSGYPIAEDTSFANTVDIIESVASIVYTKDFGENWETSLHTPIGVMMDELTIAEAEQNQICINGRGGTESAWNPEKVYRHIFFQKTPVDDRELFTIDEWEADYETRITNTIEDSIVNAGFAKIGGFTIPGANKEIQPFWLFCNIYNPNGYERHSQLLRVSPDCHNWFKVMLLTSNEEIIGGYSSIASTNDGIFIIIESSRVRKPMKFIDITNNCLTDILCVLSSVKQYYI